MPSKIREVKNKTNKNYYHRHKERLREVQRLRSLEDYTNPEKKNKKLSAQTRWRQNNPEKNILNRVKQRCKRGDIEFNLELSDIIIPEVCPVLDIKLIQAGEIWDNSPSIDRIDNSKGYIKGNIQIISMRANRIKCDASSQELRLLADYIEKLEEK